MFGVPLKSYEGAYDFVTSSGKFQPFVILAV
jgi:hypothetical protein